jgi:RNA polymerase sigma-70 factor, ECF subfamily
MGENEHSIVRAVLAGDRDAYALLVRQYSQTVFRVAFRITGSDVDAEEVVQETFFRAYRKLPSFQSRSNFGTWVYRIAVNCALDLIKKRESSGTYTVAEEPDPECMEVQLADTAAGPDRLLLSREIDRRQESAMKSLSEAERTAFVLRHVEDRSTEEIAEILAIAPNSAKQAVFRAVQKLRRELAPLWGNR